MTRADVTQLDGYRDVLADHAPMLRRAIDLDPAGLARVRIDTRAAAVFVRLPFGVLVARTVAAKSAQSLDRTVLARDLLSWLDDAEREPPQAREADWRSGLPPAGGWRRVETVPDTVIRELVRKGASALQQAAAREGVPGAQPRADVADSLLDSVVLTVTADATADRADATADRADATADRADATADRAEVTLRSLSALTRMGFLARDSHANIDVSGRWTRVAATYGSVFAERAGLGLGLALRAGLV